MIEERIQSSILELQKRALSWRSMTDYWVHHPPLRLVTAALTAGTTLLSSAGHAGAQAPISLAPVAAIAEPVFPSWDAGDVVGGYGVKRPGSAVTRESVPASAISGAAGDQGSSSVALPELHWSSDGVLGAGGLAGNAIGLSLSVTRQAVPEEGLDPSNINWGIDRDAIGNPSTSADKASDVAALATLAGPSVLALLTQPGVHGFENAVRRPFVLYGESLLLAQACTQVLKHVTDRPRPFTYVPAPERPTGSSYDVTADDAFLSLPSGHAATTFAAASYAATDNLLSRPDAGSTEHVAIAAIGGLLAGFTSNLRIMADQHFPSDALVGGLVGTASGVSVPLLHNYVFPSGGRAPHPGGHAWLVTAAGYVLGTGAGVGLSSLAF
jgi:membrane-associated phospholipid phosphatase